MNRNTYNNIISIISTITLIVAIFFTINAYQTAEEIREIKEETKNISENAVNLYKIAEILEFYETDYINPMSDDENYYMDTMLKALTKSMDDKYGGYITAQEAINVEKELTGEYVGVGIVISYPENERYILVEEVYSGTPADGVINVGDKIYKINGIDANSEEGIVELQEVATSGEKEVILTVDNKDIVLPLEKVNMDTIKISIENEIATISISNFTENSGHEFVDEFNELLRDNKVSYLIFDVRNNGGGDKDAVTQIIDRLAPAGEIYTEKYKNAENIVESDAECVDIPIYILGNENSASASELFIMSLQDTNNATFIGSQTFGKSTILGYYPLADGSSVLMSVGYYYPPSDRFIEGVGIVPDIVEEENAMAVALQMINGEK